MQLFSTDTDMEDGSLSLFLSLAWQHTITCPRATSVPLLGALPLVDLPQPLGRGRHPGAQAPFETTTDLRCRPLYRKTKNNPTKMMHIPEAADLDAAVEVVGVCGGRERDSSGHGCGSSHGHGAVACVH